MGGFESVFNCFCAIVSFLSLCKWLSKTVVEDVRKMVQSPRQMGCLWRQKKAVAEVLSVPGSSRPCPPRSNIFDPLAPSPWPPPPPSNSNDKAACSSIDPILQLRHRRGTHTNNSVPRHRNRHQGYRPNAHSSYPCPSRLHENKVVVISLQDRVKIIPVRSRKYRISIRNDSCLA